MAEKKLLAALPDTLRSLLTKAEQFVGFEQTPRDIFHPEPTEPEPEVVATRPPEQANLQQSQTVSTFFQAVLDGKLVLMHYASPYRAQESMVLVEPLGLLWDRDRWYLTGRVAERRDSVRLWRADRVVQITLR